MGLLEKELERVKFLTNISKLDRDQSQEMLIYMYDSMQEMMQYYESMLAKKLGIPQEIVNHKFGVENHE